MRAVEMGARAMRTMALMKSVSENDQGSGKR